MCNRLVLAVISGVLATSCLAVDETSVKQSRSTVLAILDKSSMPSEQKDRIRLAVDGKASAFGRDDAKRLSEEAVKENQLALLSTWLFINREKPEELVWLYGQLDARRLSIPSLYLKMPILRGLQSTPEAFPFFLDGLDDTIEALQKHPTVAASVGATDETAMMWLACMIESDPSKAMEALRSRYDTQIARPTLAVNLASEAIRVAGKRAAPFAVWYVGERCDNAAYLASMLDQIKKGIGDQEYASAASRARKRLKDCIDVIDGKGELIGQLRGLRQPTTAPGAR